MPVSAITKPIGQQENQLGTLLQSWFGPNAGLPGTGFTVQFETKEGEWHVTPVNAVLETTVEQTAPEEAESAIEIEAEVSPESQYSTHVPVYDLFVAAGVWGKLLDLG